MADIGEKFVQEFVIGFGFLSGIFLAIGIDPEETIIKSIIDLLAQYDPQLAGLYAIIFSIVSVFILIATIIASFRLGGILGLIAISLGFVAGFFILSQTVLGIILLIIAFVLGQYAPESFG